MRLLRGSWLRSIEWSRVVCLHRVRHLSEPSPDAGRRPSAAVTACQPALTGSRRRVRLTSAVVQPLPPRLLGRPSWRCRRSSAPRRRAVTAAGRNATSAQTRAVGPSTAPELERPAGVPWVALSIVGRTPRCADLGSALADVGDLSGLRRRPRQGLRADGGGGDPHLRWLRVRHPPHGSGLRALRLKRDRPRRRGSRPVLLLRPVRPPRRGQ
jgi:hypothetical protein